MAAANSIDFDAINRLALNRFDALLEQFIPGGKRVNGEYVARNPRRHDKTPGSFSINIHKGVWSDFASGDSGSDPVSLWAYLFNAEQADAARMLADHLGVPELAGTPAANDNASTAPQQWQPVLPVPVDAPQPPDVRWVRDDETGQWLKHPIAARWAYRDAAGHLLGYAARVELPGGGKDVVPQTYCRGEDGTLKWKVKALPKPRPLYNLPALAARPDAPVVLVEGEKTADAAARLLPAVVCSTWPGGSKAIEHVDLTPLQGRSVAIWPDNDAPGHDAAARLASRLQAIAARVVVVRPPAWAGDGWDLADDAPDGWSAAQHLRQHSVAPGDFNPAPAPAPANDNAPPPPEQPLREFFVVQGMDGSGAIWLHDARAQRLESFKPAQLGKRATLLALAPAAEWDVVLGAVQGTKFTADNAYSYVLGLAKALPPYRPPRTAPAPADEGGGDTDTEGSISGAPFRVLGYYRNSFHFFDLRSKQLREYGRTDMSTTGLLALAPLAWWQGRFPPSSSNSAFDYSRAVDALISACYAAGIYSPERVRARGGWLDDGRTVYHFGDHLLVDGRETDVTAIDSRYIYQIDRPLPRPAPVPMGDDEAADLLDLACSFSWQRPASGVLFAGWVALAAICGTLRWRPHLWLTGAAGSGKSTILESFVNWLLDGYNVFAQGNSSEAGIRQTLKTDALPVLFDESEQNNLREESRMQAVLSLIRQASTESAARTLKGTAGGEAMDFHIRSMFLLGSIQVGIKHQADFERVTVLGLRSAKSADGQQVPEAVERWRGIKDRLHALHRDADAPSRFIRRVVQLAPTTRRNIEVFVQVAAEHFGSQRDGDQYGTLLAGAWSLHSSQLVDVAQARAFVAMWDWSAYVEDCDTDESQKALQALMGALVRDDAGRMVSVWEVVQTALGRHPHEDRPVELHAMDAASGLLTRYGMRLEGTASLLVANKHEQLAKLVAGTAYAADLRGFLLRLPGVQPLAKTVRFAGVPSKCIALPVALVGK